MLMQSSDHILRAFPPCHPRQTVCCSHSGLFLNFTRFHPLGTFCLHTILGLLCWRVLAFPLLPCCWSVCVSCIIHSYLGSRWNKRFHAIKYMPKPTHLGLCVCERWHVIGYAEGFPRISHMALMLAPKDKISF